MSADTALSGDADRPDPTKLRTAAEFVDAMRRLKLWTGWGYRRLEKNAAAAGHALPRSTLRVALSRSTLPREELVAAFARACGCDEDQTERWVAARRRIAGAADPAAQSSVSAPPAGARRRPWTAWPLRAAAILVALGMTASIVGSLLRQSSPITPGQGEGQDQAAPNQPDQGRSQPDSPAPGTTAVPTSTNSGQPAAPVTRPTDPTVQVTVLMPSLPVPNVPTGPTNTMPPPPAPVTKTITLKDGRTIHCPLPYLDTGFGPLAQCTLPSVDQATIGFYSPVTRDIALIKEDLRILDPTWYHADVPATDGIIGTVRGYATVDTADSTPAVWATQFQSGRARWGQVDLTTHRFHPDPRGWRPTGNFNGDTG